MVTRISTDGEFLFQNRLSSRSSLLGFFFFCKTFFANLKNLFSLICGFLIPDSRFRFPVSGFWFPDYGFQGLGLPYWPTVVNQVSLGSRHIEQVSVDMSTNSQSTCTCTLPTPGWQCHYLDSFGFLLQMCNWNDGCLCCSLLCQHMDKENRLFFQIPGG